MLNYDDKVIQFCSDCQFKYLHLTVILLIKFQRWIFNFSWLFLLLKYFIINELLTIFYKKNLFLLIYNNKKIFAKFFGILYAVLFSLFTAYSSFPQTSVYSLEYLGTSLKQNEFLTRFDKQLNTFYLNSGLKLFLESEKFDVKLNENFSSTFVRGTQNSTRDEQQLNFRSSYKFEEKLKFGILGHSTVLADNRKLEINKSSVSFATLFTEVEPYKNIYFSPFAGYSSNSQIGENDYGFIYGLEGLTKNLIVSDFRLNSELRLQNEDIMPRRNLVRYFQVTAANFFEENVSNAINFLFSQSRKDFYFQTDSLTEIKFGVNNNIQGRTETIYALQDKLFYDKIFNAVSLNLNARISMRTIDRDMRYKNLDMPSTSLFDTKIEELKLDLETITKYTSVFFDGQLRFTFSERDEKNITKQLSGIDESFYEQRSEIESQKNNNSGRITLTFFGDLKFSERDKLTLSIFQSKLRYDTPSDLNDDDRDEILSILRLRYSRFLNPYFEAYASLDGTYNHTVYIFAARSSNNNVNRIIRLKAGGDYNGRNLSSYNSFEVSANYTVYDFEDITSSFQSFTFRQMTAVDSTTIRLSDRISFFVHGSLKLSEQGDLRWSNFTSRPTRYLQEIYFEPRVILYTHRSSFSAGLRYFSLNTYNFDKLNRQLDNEYSSFGPIAIISVSLWKRLSLYLNGFYEFIESTGGPDRQQANLIMQVNWKF